MKIQDALPLLDAVADLLTAVTFVADGAKDDWCSLCGRHGADCAKEVYDRTKPNCSMVRLRAMAEKATGAMLDFEAQFDVDHGGTNAATAEPADDGECDA